MTFLEFKAGEPARAMFRKMGILEYLDAASSWRGLRRLIVDFHGDDREKIEACTSRECYFRKDGHGEINAPYLDWPELDATRRHYEALQAEYEQMKAD